MKRTFRRSAVKSSLKKAFQVMGLSVSRFDYDQHRRYRQIATKFKAFSMVGEAQYVDNLHLASLVRDVSGDIVECGVWRGGMSAGIAEILGDNRTYWLFDSFEGLPPAQEIDGPAAVRWQNDHTSERYHDNCTAEEAFARRAMELSGRENVQFVKGWFKDTVGRSNVDNIALLRLDGDWYDSTMLCLEAFYQKIVDGGIVIIDDYYMWDGCARAVHDYLSRHSIANRIQQSKGGVAYIVKNVRP